MVTIRRFRAADQSAARALIESGANAFFVAELDDYVVGTTGLIVDGRAGRLVRVAVARSHRRAGVATALLEHVADFAARAGVVKLIAYTQPEWLDATAFYHSHGFSAYGRDEIDVHLRRPIAH